MWQHGLNPGRKKRSGSIGLWVIGLFRSSVDELLTHPFVKHPKKISNDPQILADDMAKILEFYTHKESNHTETNIDQLFGKKNFLFFFEFFFYFRWFQ